MKTVRLILKIFALLAGAAVLAFALLLAWLTVREYYPKTDVALAVDGAADTGRSPAPGQKLRIVSWNIGYGALDADEDFFMDGGTMSHTSSAGRVPKTIEGIIGTLAAEQPDAVFLQEVDRDSARSYHINEYAGITAGLGLANSAFANNYKCDYVPYPVPGMLGKVDSGLALLTNASVQSATRVPLPVPFSWPVRLANLKRCLLVERLPLEGTDRQLVLIDLHLEAYDGGEGKAAQTAELVSLLQREYAAGNYVIAGGDFNQSFPGADEKAYAVKNPDLWAPGTLDVTALGSEWTVAFDDSVPSCRLLNQPYDPSSPATQYYLIDGFLVSPNVTVDAVSTLDKAFAFSDHNPVRLDVTLNDVNG